VRATANASLDTSHTGDYSDHVSYRRLLLVLCRDLIQVTMYHAGDYSCSVDISHTGDYYSCSVDIPYRRLLLVLCGHLIQATTNRALWTSHTGDYYSDHVSYRRLLLLCRHLIQATTPAL